jgi:hypothetical protein
LLADSKGFDCWSSEKIDELVHKFEDVKQCDKFVPWRERGGNGSRGESKKEKNSQK